MKQQEIDIWNGSISRPYVFITWKMSTKYPTDGLCLQSESNTLFPVMKQYVGEAVRKRLFFHMLHWFLFWKEVNRSIPISGGSKIRLVLFIYLFNTLPLRDTHVMQHETLVLFSYQQQEYVLLQSLRGWGGIKHSFTEIVA